MMEEREKSDQLHLLHLLCSVLSLCDLGAQTWNRQQLTHLVQLVEDIKSIYHRVNQATPLPQSDSDDDTVESRSKSGSGSSRDSGSISGIIEQSSKRLSDFRSRINDAEDTDSDSSRDDSIDLQLREAMEVCYSVLVDRNEGFTLSNCTTGEELMFNLTQYAQDIVINFNNNHQTNWAVLKVCGGFEFVFRHSCILCSLSDIFSSQSVLVLGALEVASLQIGEIWPPLSSPEVLQYFGRCTAREDACLDHRPMGQLAP